MKTIILSATLIFALVGCGGGSSNNNNNSSSPTKEYKGALTQGDYATFTFNSSTMQLSYSIDPNSFYFSSQSGTINLTNTYGKFYKSTSPSASAMIANNVLMARVPVTSTQNAYIFGLNSSTTPTASAVAGKTYVFTHIDSNDNVSLHKIQVNANGTYSSTNLTTTATSNGCWIINGGRLQAKDGLNNCTNVNNFDYNIFIKPGSSRAGIVVDYANGDGVGIGLEQQALTNSDLAGTYQSYFYTTSSDSFAKVVIDSSGNLQWFNCPGGTCPSSATSTGSVTINQDCSSNNINGVACATIGTNKYLAFIDNVDNYFIAVSVAPTPFHVEVGSK